VVAKQSEKTMRDKYEISTGTLRGEEYFVEEQSVVRLKVNVK
jgi:hypothetical protein